MAYWPALRGGLVWDDAAHLTSPQLRSLHGLWDIWFHLGATAQYYPLLHSAFWLEGRLWGGSTIGYHLLNVVLHAASALLVVLIVRRLELPGAWLAGFVFALHPICVESVAWMSEQKSTLSGVFYLGSLLTYLHFGLTRRRWQYYVALALFVMALLSKSVTATLPAVLLAIYWWRNGGLDWKRDIRPLSGWLVLGDCSGFFTAWVEKTYVHAEGADFVLTPLQHILLAGRVVWFYAGKVLWPVNLIFNYPRWNLDPGQWWQYLFPVGLALLLAAFIVLVPRNRGPLAAFLIFAGTLTPVLGFLNVYPFRYAYVADHFQYLAALAIIVPASSLLTMAARRFSITGVPATVAGAFLALCLGVLTGRQAGMYSDAETLYQETLRRNPQSFLARTNLCGVLLQKPGGLPEAAAPCEEALRLRPDLAETHLNVGLLRAQAPGGLPQGIAEMRTALQIRPTYGAAHFDLAKALVLSRRFPEALDEYRAALALNPDYAEAWMGIGTALLAMTGRQQDAIDAFENALRLSPCNPEAHYGKGAAFLQMPDHSSDAREEFEAALECQPDYAPALRMLP